MWGGLGFGGVAWSSRSALSSDVPPAVSPQDTTTRVLVFEGLRATKAGALSGFGHGDAGWLAVVGS